jgi:Ca2+/Na+ antiporter
MPETGPGESYERNSPGRESKLSPILRSFLLVGIFLALLFIPAGRLDWWEGWAFVFAFITSVSVMVVWVNRRDPDLIKERRQPGENVKRWDRIIMGIYTILLLVMLVLASLDSGRFEWSNPPGVLRFLGWAGLSAALVIVWWSMASNPFLSKVVRIQEDRGQKVATTGPSDVRWGDPVDAVRSAGARVVVGADPCAADRDLVYRSYRPGRSHINGRTSRI